jgi:tetratricopeptide (TPR) repeat protein
MSIGAHLAAGRVVPLVGLRSERENLARALKEAANGNGSVWLLEGPGGIGKTRLSRWCVEEARAKGFRSYEANCLKEAMTPFFPFLQVFRDLEGRASAPGTLPAGLEQDLPRLLIVEEDRPREVFTWVARLAPHHPLLVAARDAPASLRRSFPELPSDSRLIWLSRSEGAEAVPPQDLDHLGELLNQHLASGPGRLVLLAGLDYLASQSGSLPVLRLVQYLRDSAEDHQGHVVLSLRPQAMETREVARLEAEGEVLRPSPEVAASGGSQAPMPEGSEPPGVTLMRYLDTLESKARATPLIIVVDDLQWADPESVRAFQFLGRGVRRLPVILLGTLSSDSRSGPTPAQLEQGLDNTLGAMDQEGLLNRLRLPPLAVPEARELIAAFLGGPFVLNGPEELLFGRAGGNPYLLLSLLRLLAEEGHVRPDRHIWHLDVSSEGGTALPQNVRQAVLRQTALLPREDADVLSVAALLGHEFESAPIVSVLDRTAGEVQETLRRLQQSHQLVVPRSGGRAVWQFAQPLARDVVVGALPAPRVAAWSGALGKWWEARYPDDLDGIARLYHQAGVPAPAIPWVRRAFDRAVETRHAEIAERYFRWLVELRTDEGASPSEILREMLPLADRFRMFTGPSSSLGRLLQLLRPLAPPGPWSWEIDGRIALHRSYSTEEAEANLRRVEGEMATVPEPPRSVVALLALARGNMESFEGKWAESAEHSRRAAELFQELGDPGRVVSASFYEANALLRLHRWTEAEPALERLGELARDPAVPSGPSALASARLSRAIERGDIGEQRRSAEENLRLNRERGDMWNVSSSLISIASIQLLQGDPGAADASLDEARRVATRFSATRDLASATLVEASLAFARGSPEVAERLLTGGRDLEFLEGLEKDELALLHLEVRSVRGAPEEVRRATEGLLAKVSGFSSYAKMRASLILARCDERSGELPAARAELLRALELAEGNRLGGAMVKARLALACGAAGEDEESRRWMEEAEAALASEPLTPEGRAWILHGEDPSRYRLPAALAPHGEAPPASNPL